MSKLKTDTSSRREQKTNGCVAASILRENIKRNVREGGRFALPGDLVKKAGMNRSTYYRFIGGETDGDLSMLDNLAGAFDVPAWRLLTPGFVSELPVCCVEQCDGRGDGKDEREFWSLFNRLDDKGRVFILKTLRNLLELGDQPRVEVATVEGSVYGEDEGLESRTNDIAVREPVESDAGKLYREIQHRHDLGDVFGVGELLHRLEGEGIPLNMVYLQTGISRGHLAKALQLHSAHRAVRKLWNEKLVTRLDHLVRYNQLMNLAPGQFKAAVKQLAKGSPWSMQKIRLVIKRAQDIQGSEAEASC